MAGSASSTSPAGQTGCARHWPLGTRAARGAPHLRCILASGRLHRWRCSAQRAPACAGPACRGRDEQDELAEKLQALLALLLQRYQDARIVLLGVIPKARLRPLHVPACAQWNTQVPAAVRP